ncbi:MAG: DUF1801 domain-containing protein [Phenylobacterium sp.]|uniref:iron chaperone n=1 Tax=Phenylobacterium sp. TaxID=1871053 RepID=UPI0012053FE0|nr:DUF1801 domain-containing protein [Phenylobacterium sp.]TAL36046.1 MAG: DUF1801 domain-containing protein [Phenylobacterium sp.]
MVQSKAATVDDWFAEVDLKREAVLRAVRNCALKHFGAPAERMSYGMPAYVRSDDEAPVFAFNSQKQHISLYVSPRVHPLYEEELRGLDAGKSCIRFRRPEQVNLDLLDRMLADSARLSSVGNGG